VAAAVTAAVLAAHGSSAAADVTLPPVSVGAGVQGNFYTCTDACVYSPGSPTTPDGTVSGFAIGTVRLYVNGSITDQIKLTFNTEYTGSGSGPGANKVEVMDAIGRFEFSDMFNIWAGRFLPPSDRANLYGPYYANDWAPYADGVADYYPNVAVGRDNGIAYWGDFSILKVQAGVFDGASLGGSTAVTDPTKVVGAARLTLDFWDKEKGYYFNGTYYGDKDILALGLAGQTQDGKTDLSLDALMEKKLADAGTVSVEAEYQRDNGLNANGFHDAQSSGWYALASYLFPQVIGVGKFQVLGKYSDKTYDATTIVAYDGDYASSTFYPTVTVKTYEANLNYIIKEFSARVGLYYLYNSESTPNPLPNTPDSLAGHEIGLKMQLQM
jgi:hypothetical protein